MTDKNLADSFRDKHLKKKPLKKKASKATNKFMHRFRKPIAAVVGAGVLASGVGMWLGYDTITKRQEYPIRDVIYQVEATVDYTGGEEGQDASSADRKAHYKVFLGDERGGIGSDIVGTFETEKNDEFASYDLQDSKNDRVAFSTEKSERVQSGINIGGALNIKMQRAKLEASINTGDNVEFLTYSIVPERGLREVELNVVVGSDGTTTLVNELVRNREWYAPKAGSNIRAGIELNEFTDTPENTEKIDLLLATIDEFYLGDKHSPRERDEIARRIQAIEETLETNPVYASYEDGLFDIFPQESSTYLFSNPPMKERTDAALHGEKATQEGDMLRLRVEHKWDKWPGRIPLLDGISIGTHPNVVQPFNHLNTGGYEITDGIGIVAKVEIEDFILRYGQDVVYNYYLDKNADGEINKDTELIGRVLHRTSQDEQNSLEDEIGKGQDKKDITRRYSYTFMAGHMEDGFDREEALEDFYLCNAVESFMANEVNRGFDSHPYIGWINHHRSSILLLESQQFEDLGRALTSESSLVARGDIVTLLDEAGRTYHVGYSGDGTLQEPITPIVAPEVTPVSLGQ